MAADLLLLIATGALISAGVFLVLDRAMTKILLGIMLIGNGFNLLILQAGGPAGSPPIGGRESASYGDQIADPLAQAMILTAIVISMALTAFILALAYQQYRQRTADIVEDDSEDTAIAARPTSSAGRDATDMSAPSQAAEERAGLSPKKRAGLDTSAHRTIKGGARD